ncbi:MULTISPECIES: NAD/NADP-dependent octopine/nopaline dehydrogenase family protein [unclassified Devosia]|uniref:NAD/NADP-dependent octopine/nopaline dehydrogenase family protein n=1 Tax=unclassified Devosia TaxID=196773 RepID=UPI00145F6677|nr:MULTISPECIES: NAD/NADP-dependent octopine/nopaline dehydrogenase family protein [unclassified Devosia]MBJ7578446.1 NAD/NADP octopine/nopaline dehydrogenase family protein [Devosia sp. MC532]
MTKVAIAGAGAVGFTSACLLRLLGNDVTLWSPSGRGTMGLRENNKITTTGSVNGTFDVNFVEDPKLLVESAKLILIAIPAYGQRSIFNQLVPYLTDEHTVLITGGQMGLGDLYLSKLLADAGKKTLIAVLNGPMTMGRKLGPNDAVQVPPKKMARISAIPADQTDRAIAVVSEAFGDRFKGFGSALEVGLMAMGGIVHSGLVMGNITRMEEGEEWCGYYYVTESISRLINALDQDRRAVAKAFGIDSPSAAGIFTQGQRPDATVREVLFPLTYERTFRNGPRKIEHRYVEEEIPYNLVTLERFGRIAGIQTPNVTRVIDMYQIMRDRDYRTKNTMAVALGIDELSVDQINQKFTQGF